MLFNQVTVVNYGCNATYDHNALCDQLIWRSQINSFHLHMSFTSSIHGVFSSYINLPRFCGNGSGCLALGILWDKWDIQFGSWARGICA